MKRRWLGMWPIDPPKLSDEALITKSQRRKIERLRKAKNRAKGTPEYATLEQDYKRYLWLVRGLNRLEWQAWSADHYGPRTPETRTLYTSLGDTGRRILGWYEVVKRDNIGGNPSEEPPALRCPLCDYSRKQKISNRSPKFHYGKLRVPIEPKKVHDQRYWSAETYKTVGRWPKVRLVPSGKGGISKWPRGDFHDYDPIDRDRADTWGLQNSLFNDAINKYGVARIEPDRGSRGYICTRCADRAAKKPKEPPSPSKLLDPGLFIKPASYTLPDAPSAGLRSILGAASSNPGEFETDHNPVGKNLDDYEPGDHGYDGNKPLYDPQLAHGSTIFRPNPEGEYERDWSKTSVRAFKYKGLWSEEIGDKHNDGTLQTGTQTWRFKGTTPLYDCTPLPKVITAFVEWHQNPVEHVPRQARFNPNRAWEKEARLMEEERRLMMRLAFLSERDWWLWDKKGVVPT